MFCTACPDAPLTRLSITELIGNAAIARGQGRHHVDLLRPAVARVGQRATQPLSASSIAKTIRLAGISTITGPCGARRAA